MRKVLYIKKNGVGNGGRRERIFWTIRMNKKMVLIFFIIIIGSYSISLFLIFMCVRKRTLNMIMVLAIWNLEGEWKIND